MTLGGQGRCSEEVILKLQEEKPARQREEEEKAKTRKGLRVPCPGWESAWLLGAGGLKGVGRE